MKEAFVLYRSYQFKDELDEMTALLKREKIEFDLVDNSHELIEGIVGAQNLSSKFQLLLRPQDFDKVNNIIATATHENIDKLPKDYHLFSFSNDELIAIVSKPEEWGAFDYQLAKKLLIQKGIVLDEEWFNVQKQNRNIELGRPKKAHPLMIYAGYGLAILGGFLGIIIGHILWKANRTLPNGEHINIYRDEDRREGKRIFIIGCIILPISLILKTWSALEKLVY